MKLSHILYKVDNLKESKKEFEDLGFVVEYGSKYNPHNALIYFSEGPYIELLERAPISIPAKYILKFIFKDYVLKRLNSWAIAPKGFFEICLETADLTFKNTKSILKANKEPFFITKSKRLDPKNRLLRWKLLFPRTLSLPFFMTRFNINPKPKDFIHPNGVKKVRQLTYGTDPKNIPILMKLCFDNSLNIVEGNGIKEITFDAEKEINFKI